MTNPRDLENDKDDGDVEIGRPHGSREDEEERGGDRVSATVAHGEEEEHELRDEELLFDDDEDLADDGDLDIEPDDDRM